jgi:bidirectional [NiFe] hydrogenase diaphorase subunit
LLGEVTRGRRNGCVAFDKGAHLMTVSQIPAKPPSDDKRWRIVEATMRRHGYDRHALIESLHSVQQVFGYLEEPAIRYVATALKVPISKAYGVATFYHHFTLKPQGKHACVVCMGTACYIKGSGKMLDELSEHYHVKEGATTTDGELSLVSARCIGACGLAPAVVLDGEVLAKHTTAQVITKIEGRIHP